MPVSGWAIDSFQGGKRQVVSCANATCYQLIFVCLPIARDAWRKGEMKKKKNKK